MAALSDNALLVTLMLGTIAPAFLMFLAVYGVETWREALS